MIENKFLILGLKCHWEITSSVRDRGTLRRNCRQDCKFSALDIMSSDRPKRRESTRKTCAKSSHTGISLRNEISLRDGHSVAQADASSISPSKACTEGIILNNSAGLWQWWIARDLILGLTGRPRLEKLEKSMLPRRTVCKLGQRNSWSITSGPRIETFSRFKTLTLVSEGIKLENVRTVSRCIVCSYRGPLARIINSLISLMKCELRNRNLTISVSLETSSWATEIADGIDDLYPGKMNLTRLQTKEEAIT